MLYEYGYLQTELRVTGFAFFYISEYIRRISCSNTRKTHTSSKAEIMAVILRRLLPSETHYEAFYSVAKSHQVIFSSIYSIYTVCKTCNPWFSL